MPTFSEAPTMEIPAVTDDLRAVRGIGPSMERMLHNLGIVSFRQLAMLDGGELERVRAELSDFRSRIEREDWVGQARTLYREKYGRDPS
jgi:predicted flap endonuclease-1-like 5' DNA nuclease